MTTLTPEQQAYVDQKLHEIRAGGYCSHSVWVADCVFGMGSANLAPVEPKAVGMANDDDGYYVQYFNSREEVEAFIAELRKAADEAWGVEKPYADKAAQFAHMSDRIRIDPVTGNVGIGSKE